MPTEPQEYYSPQFYKNNAITAAQQLVYPKEVIEKLRNAKDDDEVSLIMASQRKHILDCDDRILTERNHIPKEKIKIKLKRGCK